MEKTTDRQGVTPWCLALLNVGVRTPPARLSTKTGHGYVYELFYSEGADLQDCMALHELRVSPVGKTVVLSHSDVTPLRVR